ncbi:hypothetical protein CBR_g11048 [Chara braunii]|uniref:Calcineurin-like phosphoesterase domain-containing protein n=1 Tax=Chara braunii TaxID=69332 RepID=A0A388KPZ4_CHABU|nr:hypothetical protein CBR_g11048 [Chara braunii]|eukprot:GBG72115.1 hypothetical protein CBR_g11048 [Chara braunii]
MDEKARLVVTTEESCERYDTGTSSPGRWTRRQVCSAVIGIAVVVIVTVILAAGIGSKTRGSNGDGIGHKPDTGSSILPPPRSRSRSLPPSLAYPGAPLLVARPLTFLAVGDWGRAGDYNQSDVARAMGDVAASRGGVDFVISTGDNFYPAGLAHADDANFSISFSDMYTSASLQRPWFVVLGNHDYRGDPSIQTGGALTTRDWRWRCNRTFEVRRDLCAESALQDADDRAIRAEEERPSPSPGQSECNATVSIFFIDTSPFSLEYSDAAEMNWFVDRVDLEADNSRLLTQLAEKLKAAENDTWRIVVGHHPLYSSSCPLGTPGLTERLLPILERGAVDLYINGHDHDLEHVKKGFSPVHMLTTGAGSQLNDVWLPVDDDYLFRLQGNGFLYVDVDAYRIRSDFYDVRGKVVHSFEVVK